MKRLITTALAVLFCFSAILTPAFALEHTTAMTPTNATEGISGRNTVMAVDNSREYIPNTSFGSPPTSGVHVAHIIPGYTISSYEMTIHHIFTPTGDRLSAYLTGFADGTVRPGAEITRAAVATILYRLSGSPQVPSTGGFSDVQPGQWHYTAIRYLSSTGVVAGFPDGTFRPDAPILRSEMALILARYAELDITTPGRATFPDVPAGRWYFNAVTTLADEGWITGMPNGNFAPANRITRAEAVTMINRMLGRTGINVPANVSNPFSDVAPGRWYFNAIMSAAVDHYCIWHADFSGDTAQTTVRFADAQTFRAPSLVSPGVIDEIAPAIHPTNYRLPILPPSEQWISSGALNGWQYVGYEREFVYLFNPETTDGFHGGGWSYRTSIDFRTRLNPSRPAPPVEQVLHLQGTYVSPGDIIRHTVVVENATPWAIDGNVLDGLSVGPATEPMLNTRIELDLNREGPLSIRSAGDIVPGGTLVSDRRLDFLRVEGNFQTYTWNPTTRILIVYLGDIPLGAARSVNLDFVVNENQTMPREIIILGAPTIRTDNRNMWTGAFIASSAGVTGWPPGTQAPLPEWLHAPVAISPAYHAARYGS